MASVTTSTTTCPKRTPELKKAKGVSAARYSGLHFIMLVSFGASLGFGPLSSLRRPASNLDDSHVSYDHTPRPRRPNSYRAGHGRASENVEHVAFPLAPTRHPRPRTKTISQG